MHSRTHVCERLKEKNVEGNSLCQKFQISDQIISHTSELGIGKLRGCRTFTASKERYINSYTLPYYLELGAPSVLRVPHGKAWWRSHMYRVALMLMPNASCFIFLSPHSFPFISCMGKVFLLIIQPPQQRNKDITRLPHFPFWKKKKRKKKIKLQDCLLLQFAKFVPRFNFHYSCT